MATREKVITWAEKRGLFTNPKVDAQFVKLIEELGELARGIKNRDAALTIDSIGDARVVLTILAWQLGLNDEECFDSAYEVIKNRKGKTENGVFIKEGC